MLSWHCSRVYKQCVMFMYKIISTPSRWDLLQGQTSPASPTHCVMFRYKIITTPTRWDPLQGQTSHTAFFVRLLVKYLISICRFTECIDFLMLKLIKDQVPLFVFSASHLRELFCVVTALQ